ncbi:MAG: hypothetical protein QOH84_6919 [Kribbellaceae bacterium]|nr:hypothetical protein [Kribbellaceae bacterium]
MNCLVAVGVGESSPAMPAEAASGHRLANTLELKGFWWLGSGAASASCGLDH